MLSEVKELTDEEVYKNIDFREENLQYTKNQEIEIALRATLLMSSLLTTGVLIGLESYVRASVAGSSLVYLTSNTIKRINQMVISLKKEKDLSIKNGTYKEKEKKEENEEGLSLS